MTTTILNIVYGLVGVFNHCIIHIVIINRYLWELHQNFGLLKAIFEQCESHLN
jgi:hypothetical protein